MSHFRQGARALIKFDRTHQSVMDQCPQILFVSMNNFWLVRRIGFSLHLLSSQTNSRHVVRSVSSGGVIFGALPSATHGTWLLLLSHRTCQSRHSSLNKAACHFVPAWVHPHKGLDFLTLGSSLHDGLSLRRYTLGVYAREQWPSNTWFEWHRQLAWSWLSDARSEIRGKLRVAHFQLVDRVATPTRRYLYASLDN